MIRLAKGKMFGSEDPSKLITLSFSFRKEMLHITNLIRTNKEPYMGCELDKTGAIKLQVWLQNVIEQSKICDECYNFELPDNFCGELICKKCNNKIIKNELK